MRFLSFILLLTTISTAGFAAMPVREEPVTALPQWQDFQYRQSRSLNALSLCERDPESCQPKELGRWVKLLDDLKYQNRLRQIITVNRWFNRLPYRHDEYAYDTLDYWADTAELLEKRGDCEDYALSKYYTLRELGFSPDELKIMVVYDEVAYVNHAVLMVYIDGTRYMLDINADSTDPWEMGNRYRPIYGFNEQTAWFYQ